MVAADPRNGVGRTNLNEIAPRPPGINPLLRADIVIDPRHYVFEIEVGDIIRPKIIVLPCRGSGRKGVRLGIQRKDFEGDRVEPVGGNLIAREWRPHPLAGAIGLPGQRIVNRDQPV